MIQVYQIMECVHLRTLLMKLADLNQEKTFYQGFSQTTFLDIFNLLAAEMRLFIIS